MEDGESHSVCIERECMEEAGYRTLVKDRVCSAEAYTTHPTIPYFHPMQTYYCGEILEKVGEPTEEDHTLCWVECDELMGKLYVEMQDISRIAEIIVFGKRVAYRSIFQDDIVSFNELQVINLVEEYRNNPTLVDEMLVYDDGIIKGVVSRNIQEDGVEICELYVEPFFKGNGIGKKLIQQVILEARTHNRKRISLWVIEENLSARRFYENNGFIANGKTSVIEGTTKKDMCYELIV